MYTRCGLSWLGTEFVLKDKHNKYSYEVTRSRFYWQIVVHKKLACTMVKVYWTIISADVLQTCQSLSFFLWVSNLDLLNWLRWIGPNQEKSEIFIPSRFEHLHQPFFGFWLLAWSRCDRIVSSRKDSWYQDYSILLTAASPSCHEQPALFVPDRPKHLDYKLVSISIERTMNQNIEVLLFLYFRLNLDHCCTHENV